MKVNSVILRCISGSLFFGAINLSSAVFSVACASSFAIGIWRRASASSLICSWWV